MEQSMLRCEGLRKSYGDREAVKGVSFSIAEGECYGLLGPNGAGKTTTISMLCGLIIPDQGEVTVDGFAGGSLEAKAAVGYVPQDLALYPDLSAVENLTFFGQLYGLGGKELHGRIGETLELVGLADRGKDRIGTYSGGMKRRANMAAGLLHRPKLLVLDEPTVGVDPQSRNAILETVGRLGIAVLYTTHYMEEAARLCDRIGIIDDGQLIAEGTAESLIGTLRRPGQGAPVLRRRLARRPVCCLPRAAQRPRRPRARGQPGADHGPRPGRPLGRGRRRHEARGRSHGGRGAHAEPRGRLLEPHRERAPGLIRVIAWNELHRRLRDRSVLIGCLAAPLLMAAVLGLSFAGGANVAPVHIGVSGTSPQTLTAALAASQLPKNVTVTRCPASSRSRTPWRTARLDGGVAVLPSQLRLHTLLVPIVDPGATHTPGFDVVTKGTSPLGEEYAESVAAGDLERHVRQPGTPTRRRRTADDPATVAVNSQDVGHGGKVNLNFFAPNIAVVFLFIGSGLGMRSLLMERSAGTLARITAAPVRPTQIVLGKLLAIFLTGLATIFVIWAVTTYGFGADWGNLLGVLLMAIAATAAMCGIGVFLTSLAKTEQQAFGITLLVGLFLALVGGNLLPSGSLPDAFQVLALGTPNGWALVGFGRLDQLREPASSIIGPFVILLVIAAGRGRAGHDPGAQDGGAVT